MLNHKLVKDGKTYKTIGIILWCMIPIYFIMYFSGDLTIEGNTSPITVLSIFVIFLGAIGGAIFHRGSAMIKRADVYSDCAKQLYEVKSVDIESLVKKLNCRYDEVVADLQNLIKTGYFQNAEIDFANRKLILTAVSKPVTVMKCPHCGGQNKVTDTTGSICEYCDSPMEV